MDKQTRPDQTPSPTPAATTAGRWIEYAVCLLVLSVAATVMVPRFSQATMDDRTPTLRSRLAIIRAQIQRYHDQHDRQWPTVADFHSQMVSQTDPQGQRPADQRQDIPLDDPPAGDRLFGPYLLRIPDNPFTGGNSVGDGPVGATDWFYDQNTGEFRANDSHEHRRY